MWRRMNIVCAFVCMFVCCVVRGTSSSPLAQNDMSMKTYTEIAKSCSYMFAPIQQIHQFYNQQKK
jgi:hypothetical protein